MRSDKIISKSVFLRTGSAKKILLWLLILLCVLFLIPFFGIPAYLSSNSGRDLILSKINNSIDGTVEMSSFSMGWFSGVKAQKLNFTDDKGSTKATVEEIAARPSYLSLLGGKVSIDQATVDRPHVSITVLPDELSKPEKSSEKSSSPKAETPAFPLDRMDLTIKEGNFKINTPGAGSVMQTLELKDINSRIALRPLGSKSSFDVSMTVADANKSSDVSAAGDMKTTGKEWSMANTTGNLKVKINDLELATLAPLLDILDVNVTAAGRVRADFDAQIKKGQFENLEGTINADNLDVSGDILKGDRLQTTKFATDVKLSTTENSVKIDRLKIQADGLTADVKGAVPKTLDSLESFLQADSADTLQATFDCDLAKTVNQIRTIANFKEDIDIQYGRLSGNINTEAMAGKRMLSGKIKLWALEGKFPVKQIILSKPVELDAKIVSQKDVITVEKLDVDSSFVKASLNGTADNMNYIADVDLERLQADMGQFFEIKPKLSGSAQLTGKGSLVKRVFAGTGTALLKDILILTPEGQRLSEPTANAGYDFSVNLDKKLLTAKTADLSASVGKISLRDLSMPFGKDNAEPTKLNANVAVELEKLMSWLSAFGKVDSKTQFAGLVKGDFFLNKTGNVIEASTKQTNITNLKIAQPGKQPFTQPNMAIAFTGKFDTAKKIYDIPNLNVSSPQINISGSLSNADLGTVTKTQGDFKADYELAAVTSIISPFMPAGLSASGKRNDALKFSSTYSKTVPAQFTSNLNAKTTFGFDKAEYMGLLLGKSDFNVQIDKGQMTIAPFSTVVNQGKLNFAASANLDGKPALLKTPGQMKLLDKIQINQQTTDALLRYMNPIFADAVNVTGILNFDCEKLAVPLQKGYQNAIAVTGTLAIDNMHLGGSSLLRQILQLTGEGSDPTITVLPTRFVLADGILSYDNMQMNINDKPINFAGRIGLDKSMQMRVTLPWTHNGQRITLPLKGTVDKPEIDMGKLLEEQATQELERQIKKGLEQIFK